MVGQKTCSLHELLTRLVITENPFQMCFMVVWPTKGTGGLQHHKFSIFDGKQHPKKFGSVDVKITPDFCS